MLCHKRVNDDTLFKCLDLPLQREYPEVVNPVLEVHLLDSVSLQLTNW